MKNFTLLTVILIFCNFYSKITAQCNLSAEFQKSFNVYSKIKDEYYKKNTIVDFDVVDTIFALDVKKLQLKMAKSIANEVDFVSYLSHTFDAEYFFTGERASKRYTREMSIVDFEEKFALDENPIVAEAFRFVNSQIEKFEIFNLSEPRITLKKKYAEYSNYELFIIWHLLKRYSGVDWDMFFRAEDDKECMKIKNSLMGTGCDDYMQFGRVFISCDCDKIHGVFIPYK